MEIPVSARPKPREIGPLVNTISVPKVACRERALIFWAEHGLDGACYLGQRRWRVMSWARPTNSTSWFWASPRPARAPITRIARWSVGTLCLRPSRAKSFSCQGCGERTLNSEMFKVMEPDHLTFWEGDALCALCAELHGLV